MLVGSMLCEPGGQWGWLTGFLPDASERKLLDTMLREGDPINPLADTASASRE